NHNGQASWLAYLAAKCRHDSFIHLPRHAHVVQVVFSNLSKPSGLIQLEHPASLDFICLARRNSERPRQIIERHSIPRAKPPAMHRVVHASHVELRQIHKRTNRDVVDETSLKDERQIEPDDVMPDDLVNLGIKALHQRQEVSQCFLFTLLLSVRVNTEDVFAFEALDSFDLDPGHRADVNGNRQYTSRRRRERAKFESPLFFG